ncbi:MAG TPA: hypothetical protein DCD96_02625 [Flavobacteriales bacterium]|nr:hypothetical protein [Flavobacteriales bacterium]HRE75589.1 hypothetical protein [Flavobacteriales bacterium]HRJ34922.1 hypothetical protein [Flavobacteriales bacterium]HRJ40085.1 hypothetical protein [Flavobacteriales bacterium]
MRKTTLFFFLIVSLLFLNASAQQNTSSPYSRYAFGELNTNPLAQYNGMGNASIAVADSFLLNLSNPASFSNLMIHRPIFDIGVGGQRLQVRSEDVTEYNGSFGLRNITLGIPISRRAGFSFGILPFSSVGYTISQTVAEPSIGNVTYTYTGTGGINRLYLGAGYKILSKKNSFLSLGLRGSYLFGNIQRVRKAVYPGYTGIMHTKIRHNTIVSDFLFDGGLLYKAKVFDNSTKKDSIKSNKPKPPGAKHFLSLGLTYTSSSQIGAKQEMIAHTFSSIYFETPVDTVMYADTISGYMNFPQRIGFGFAYDIHKESDGGRIRRYMFSGQYEQQTWSTYSEVFGNNTVQDQLRNSRSIGLGFQFTPDVSPYLRAKSRIWELTNYRMGLRYSDTYLQLNNNQLKQYGISFGLGIPLTNSTKSLSMINFGCEVGRKGTTENQLLQENFFNFFVGFSISPAIHEEWFHKRKYD